MAHFIQLPSGRSARNLLAVYVAAFFASLGFSFVTPLLPLFTLELLDGDLARVAIWVGIAVGIAPLLTALTGPWWGVLGNRVGQKKMIQRALVSIGVAIALMALIDHPWQLVGLRAAIGALGGITVACLAAVSVSSNRKALGRDIGYLQATQIMGQVAGPLLGGGLALLAGVRPTFVISAALFALAFGLVAWLYRDVPRQAPRPAEARVSADKEPASLAGSPLFWSMLVVLFSANFLDGSFLVLLPLYLPLVGAPADSLALTAGLGLSGGALAMAVAAAYVGRLTNRFSDRLLIFGMLAGVALVLLVIVYAASWWQFLALRVLLGLLAGGLPTVAYSAAAGLVPPARSGAVVGLASSAGLLGWALSPLLVGLLVGVNPRAVFLMDLALVGACGLTLMLAGGRPSWRMLRGSGNRLAHLSR